MDVNAACAGFMYALVTAAQFVHTGSASQCALVVGAEVMSRTINPADVKTYPLFGDGAGAVLRRATDDAVQRSAELYTSVPKVVAVSRCAYQVVAVVQAADR